MDIIKVSATSRTSAVAGAIAGVIRENNKADVQAIGAGAVNQAVKALILANGYLKEDGIHVACIPEFVDVEIEDKVRTAIRLVVKPMSADDEERSVRREEGLVSPEQSPEVTEEPSIFQEELEEHSEGSDGSSVFSGDSLEEPKEISDLPDIPKEEV